MAHPLNVVVVGATGLVGRTLLQVLEERRFPVGTLRLAASPRSVGQRIPFAGRDIEVETLTDEVFQGSDLTFFTVSNAIAAQWVPRAAEVSGLVIDNSSQFRLDPSVPLVVPEVNPEALFSRPANIIANPNCSTIQMVVALKPIHVRFQIQRVVVSTYQAVSGAGNRGRTQLREERAGEDVENPETRHPILDNVIPHISAFLDTGETKEEFKMVEETRKILGEPTLRVQATCVRVPVPNCHSESVLVECARPFHLSEIRALLEAAPGIVVQDDPATQDYPLATRANGKDQVFVGRLRVDRTVPHGLALWIVADNLRKGAASNAVDIAERWWARHPSQQS